MGKIIQSTKVGNFISEESAKAFGRTLMATTRETYWRPYYSVCPAGGSFDVFVTSDYGFGSQEEFLEHVCYWLADRVEAKKPTVTITDAERKALLGDDEPTTIVKGTPRGKGEKLPKR